METPSIGFEDNLHAFFNRSPDPINRFNLLAFGFVQPPSHSLLWFTPVHHHSSFVHPPRTSCLIWFTSPSPSCHGHLQYVLLPNPKKPHTKRRSLQHRPQVSTIPPPSPPTRPLGPFKRLDSSLGLRSCQKAVAEAKELQSCVVLCPGSDRCPVGQVGWLLLLAGTQKMGGFSF